jgi:hypothetical protein
MRLIRGGERTFFALDMAKIGQTINNARQKFGWCDLMLRAESLGGFLPMVESGHTSPQAFSSGTTTTAS